MDTSFWTKEAAELLAEIAHNVNVRSSEAIDRLPVIPNSKYPCVPMLRLERLDQFRAALRDILEFVDENMPKGALELPLLRISRRSQNHVLEVNSVSQMALIFAIDGSEDVQEGLSAHSELQLLRFLPAAFEIVSSTLELAKECAQQTRETIDLPKARHAIVDLFSRKRLECHIGSQLLGKSLQQVPLLALIAVGLDQNGLVFGVDLTLPRHSGEVFISVNEWRRDEALYTIGTAIAPHAEMLDIDSTFDKSEVRRVDPAATRL